jgi:spore germination cell wall hydrolase CwlJ-like protein
MSERLGLCDGDDVIFERTVVVAAAALCFAPLRGGAVPTITLDAAAPPESRQSITVTIPKYTLTENERELVASCLVLEAASQGDFGMRGVMAVIRNRSRGLPELFAITVLREKQFSALNALTAGHESMPRLIRRAQRDVMWPVALTIVDDATRDDWRDPTEGATHYTRVGEHTRWTHALAQTTIIGRHAFYR